MLTREENELVTQTDRGTPMGELFRRYWQPFLLSQELPEPDGAPIRVGLLGEKLITFRDSDGRVGLIQENCPHRGASLFYGLNQNCGVTCVYHGFKFNAEGKCIDTPSDAPGNDFRERVRMRAYPVIESAGLCWAYMGPPEKRPAPPGFIFNHLPPEHVVAARVPIYCNWLQSVEGNIDSTHLGTLHTYYQDLNPIGIETDKPGYCSPQYSLYIRAKYRYAQIDVQDTDYGFRLIAVRPTDKGNQHVRINCHVLPEHTFIAAQGRAGSLLNAVPVDDHNCFRVHIQYNEDRPFTADERIAFQERAMLMDPANPSLRLKREENHYMIDRQAQKRTFYAGIWPIPEQDYAMTESMGKIFDRTNEQLYPADAAIIRLRQQLITAARNLQNGIEPPGLSNNIPWGKIRSEEIIIGPNDDPWQVANDAGEAAARGEKLIVPVG
ncbi:MAG: Rieske 2Fe-2S domain-containing protein [Chloroflexota bacterium]